jgi:UDP-2-acetamido-2-deoxy-ribo-hexuluronate aminotransferase
MDFIDLKKQQQRIRESIDRRIAKVLDHGRYILGPEITELESKLAAFCGTKHCVSCASGTDALLMGLMVLGVGPGDAVFVPSFTFVATAEVVALLGACPVFVDCDKQTFNMSPGALEQAIAAVSESWSAVVPRGVIAVDLFGQPADYDEIGAVAEKHGLWLMEDAAQSFGATYKGKRACALAPVGATSFFPAKPLGCYGDGGAVFCDDDEFAAALRSIRVHGQGTDKYDNVRLGINGRCDTLQAAILLAKLEIFEEEIDLRDGVARRYNEGLKGGKLTAPSVNPDRTSVWAQYSLLAENREACLSALKAKGIPTAVYYPIPLHRQQAYVQYVVSGLELPVCEDLARRVFSIPMHPYLSDTDQAGIIDALSGV